MCFCPISPKWLSNKSPIVRFFRFLPGRFYYSTTVVCYCPILHKSWQISNCIVRFSDFFLKRAFFDSWLIERGTIHVIRACFVLWLKERGMFLSERACFVLWLKERGIITFGARLFCFMALRTRNVTFAARIVIAKQRKLKRIVKWKQSSKNRKNRGIVKRNSRMEIIVNRNWIMDHNSYSTILRISTYHTLLEISDKELLQRRKRWAVFARYV